MAEPIQTIPLGLLAAAAHPSMAPLASLMPAPVSPGRAAPSRAEPPQRGQGLFAGLFNNKPSGYTPQDVQKVMEDQSDYWQRFPITPQWNGGRGAGGILPGIANFGSGFMGSHMQGRQADAARENERIRRDAADTAGRATTLEDAVRALQGGTPDQSSAALQLHLQNLAKERERERQAAIMERVYGAGAATPSAQSATAPVATEAPAMPASQPPAPSAPAAPPTQLRTTWPFPTDAPPTAQPSSAPPASLPNPGTDFMMPPAPTSAQAAPALRPQHPLTPEGVSQEQIDRLPLNRPTAPAPMPPAPPLANMQQPQATPQSEPMVQIGQMSVPLSEARRRAAIGRAQGIDVKPLEEAISLAETGPRAAATEAARAQAQAQGGLAQAVNSAQSTIEKLDEIATDPQLERLIGWAWYNPLGYLPDNPQQKALRARIAQVQGRFFLQAFDALRGSGQISNVEGEKAQESIARIMNTDQDLDSYRTAIEDARREIWALTNTARTRAGLAAVPYQPAAPAVGSVRDGYRFNGGDPASPQSWQKVQ